MILLRKPKDGKRMTTKGTRRSEVEYRRQFEEAIRLRDEGRLAEASELLLNLESGTAEDLPVNLIRAGILFDRGCFDEARELFANIITLQPRSELASRGLFFSLWKLGRRRDALDEMQRFLFIADSQAYRQLLSEIMEGLKE